MLKTVAVSSNKKTGPIAVTYRSGAVDVYGTCPTSCKLNPNPAAGTCQVDAEYLQAVYESVPRNGVAWAYSHFPAAALPPPAPGKTTINASCDTIADAVRATENGHPAVYAAPLADAALFPTTVHGVRFLRCPAELSDNFRCSDCGNGSPLCARGNRDYVVVFVAHGPSKKRVGDQRPGGCYGGSGPVHIQWRNTKKTGAANDAAALRQFVKTLPARSMLRHHILGDVGRDLQTV